MAGTGTGPGAITNDGCPVEVYAALSVRRHEARIVQQFLAPGASVLDLGAGTGLIAEPLAESGYRVIAVDNSTEMLAHLRTATPLLGDIEGIQLDERFDVVLLASNLVNTPDAEERERLLTTAVRHVKPSGRVLIEWHPPEWFDALTVGATLSTFETGVDPDVQRPPPRLGRAFRCAPPSRPPSRHHSDRRRSMGQRCPPGDCGQRP